VAKFKATISNEIKPIQQDIKKFNEALAGVDLLKPVPTSLDATMTRMQKLNLLEAKTKKKAVVAKKRKDFIQAIHHPKKPRSYKELPQLFKFCLFKNKPRRFLVRGKVSEFIEPVKEQVNFRGLVAEVTYYEGELGDTDRMVYLAILNEAILHKEFVKEFGKIPFSMDELANKAGLGKSNHRQEIVEESLHRLQTTNLLFKHGTGGSLKERFHLIENYTCIEKVKVNEEVKDRLHLLGNEPQTPTVLDTRGPDAFVTYFQKLQGQAGDLLAKFKPHTTKLTLVKFNEPLMKAICGDEITTVDMWALQRLTRNSARALYLYLYDVSQWRTSKEPLEIPLLELLQLMDVTPTVDHKNGKDYPQWTRTIERVQEYLEEVNQVAQFVEHFEWLGEGEQLTLRVQLCDDVPQISKY
jgi:hypothetical protein